MLTNFQTKPILLLAKWLITTSIVKEKKKDHHLHNDQLSSRNAFPLIVKQHGPGLFWCNCSLLVSTPTSYTFPPPSMRLARTNNLNDKQWQKNGTLSNQDSYRTSPTPLPPIFLTSHYLLHTHTDTHRHIHTLKKQNKNKNFLFGLIWTNGREIKTWTSRVQTHTRQQLAEKVPSYLQHSSIPRIPATLSFGTPESSRSQNSTQWIPAPLKASPPAISQAV